MAEETVTKPTSASIVRFPQRTRINPTGKMASTPRPGCRRVPVGAFLPTIQQMQQVWQNSLSPDVPETQLREMKKAFASGVSSLFQVLNFDVPKVSGIAGESYLKHLDLELAKYFQEVQ